MRHQSYWSGFFFLLIFSLVLTACDMKTPDETLSESEPASVESESITVAPVNEDGDVEVEEVGSGADDEAQSDEGLSDDEVSDASVDEGVVTYKMGELQPYDEVLFEQALASGEAVFIDVYAPWCPICRGNEAAVKQAIESTGVVSFRVDYDSESEFKSAHGVTTQSTYILFRNGEEVARTLGAQTTDQLLDLIRG